MRLPIHLERLAASLAELYGATLDPGIAAGIEDVAATLRADRGRLRILADPDGHSVVTASPEAGPRDSVIELTPFALPGGLGRHKWRDRRLLDALAAQAPGSVPLLVDTDGLVLEAAHANVWIVEDEILVTPPADGRILPGITRAALLADYPSALQEPIELSRLESADSIFLTSSIAGRRPAVIRRRPGSAT